MKYVFQVKTELKRLIEEDIIEESNARISSSALCIPKK